MKPFKIFLAISLVACLGIAFIACKNSIGSVVGGTETIIVEVTDTNGEVVTDEQGNAVTEIVVVSAGPSDTEGKFKIEDANPEGGYGPIIRPSKK